MEEHGIVTRIEGDMALVEFIRSSDCTKCGLCKASAGNRAILLCRNPLKAVVGDQVRVEIGSAQLLRGSAVIYLLPLLSMFIGYAIGAGFSETAGIAGSIIFLVLIFALLRWYGKRYGLPLTSEITEVVEPWRAYP